MDFKTPIRPFYLSEIILFVLGIIVITSCYFYIERKRNNLKINYFFAIALGVVFLYGLIVIITIPGAKEFNVVNKVDPNIVYHGTLYTSAENRVYYIFFLAIALLCTFLFIDVFPKKYRFLGILNLGFYIALLVMIICMIYSYIAEANAYVGFVKNLLGNQVDYETTVHSWWKNRSNYSVYLMFMIFYTLYVHHVTKKWWLYPLAGFIFLNLIFTLSKTNIPLSAILIVGYLIARFFITYKDNKKRNLIALAILGGLALIAVGTFVVLYNVGPLSEKLHHAFQELFVSHDGINNTIQTRVWIWEHVIDILNNSSWVFGAGFGYFNDLLGEYNAYDYKTIGHNPTNMPHNFFLQVIGEGGILYLALVLLFFGIFIYYLIKIAKKHKTLVALESIFFVVMLVHLTLESSGPFVHCLPSVEGLIFSFLLWIPVSSAYYHDKYPEDNDEIISQAKEATCKHNKFFNNTFSISNAIYCFFTAAMILILGPLAIYHQGNMPVWLIVLMILSSILYLICPYIIQRIYNAKHNLDSSNNNLVFYMLHIVLPFLVLLVVLVAFTRIYSAIMGNAFGVVMFEGYFALMVYVASFIFIPTLRNSGEFLYVLCANLNNFMVRENAKYIEISRAE